MYFVPILLSRMDPDIEDQSGDSCGDILATDVKSSALDLTMETCDEEAQKTSGSEEHEDAADTNPNVVLDEGTCVLVLPVNQPDDTTTGEIINPS